MSVDKSKRVGRWYFGGIASAGAAFCTQPLDLIKVQLQTQQGEKLKASTLVIRILKNDGILGLYDGLSASLLRQLTYSLIRFAIYDTIKKQIEIDKQPIPFYQKVLLAGFAGAVGAVVGTPANLVMVRMQNDNKLPMDQRRNYKHAFDGLYRVYSQEGIPQMFNGATMACTRAVFVTIGQLACYDQIKSALVTTDYFEDNLITHFTSSVLAGTIATFFTMPIDVMKTRMMNAPPGTYKNILSCAVDISKNGPLGFFKGFIPRFVRLGPHTVFTFIFYEQLRKNFGDDV